MIGVKGALGGMTGAMVVEGWMKNGRRGLVRVGNGREEACR